MLRHFFRKTPLAWLQLKREKTRFAIALAGIAFADILIFFQLGLLDALFDSTAKPYTILQGDLFIINPLFENLTVIRSFSRHRFYQAKNLEGIASSGYLYIDQGEWRNPETLKNKTTMVFAINPNGSVIDLPEVQPQLYQLKLLNRMLFDQSGRKDFFGDVVAQLEHADSVSIQFNDAQASVIGYFRLGTSFAADGNVITSHSTFLRLFPERHPDQIDVGVLTLLHGVDRLHMQALLQAIYGEELLVLTREEFVAREKEYWQTSSPIGILFGFGAIIGFIVGTVIVYQILHSDVSDHLPEYATLKAMGYSDRYLVGILIQESLIMAVLGFIPGFSISLMLYSAASAATFLPIAMTVTRAGLVLMLTIVMCIASGSIAIRRLQDADPADIF